MCLRCVCLRCVSEVCYALITLGSAALEPLNTWRPCLQLFRGRGSAAGRSVTGMKMMKMMLREGEIRRAAQSGTDPCDNPPGRPATY